MKQVLCALLMLGLSSTALASKSYYVCSLVSSDRTVTADPEILVQFQAGLIIYKGGEATGACVAEVKYMGNDDHYGSRVAFGGELDHANTNCKTFNTVDWYSADGQGYETINPRGTIELGSVFNRTTWAKYSCK
ncbi:hypothetical protein [Bdellovibrio sp. HCB274]|uniref:hypothetical protein n=1 Tax=Bdellovibrio sp. HCB274 TaxID=3394361 RepID=UPI0039B51A37